MEIKTHFNNEKNLLAVQDKNTILVNIDLFFKNTLFNQLFFI